MFDMPLKVFLGRQYPVEVKRLSDEAIMKGWGLGKDVMIVLKPQKFPF